MHPPATRRAFDAVLLRAVIAVALALAILAIPTKQRCGAPDYSCASAVDTQGNLHYYYEVEPLGVYLAEIVTGSNIRVYYKSGEELVKTPGH